MQLSDLIDPQTGERKYLNKEERQLFKQAIQYLKPAVKTYCGMLYYTGCRLSEALEVNPNALDFSEGWVRLRTLKQKSATPRYRIVELPSDYMATLESVYKAQTNKGKARAGKRPLWSFTDRTARNHVSMAMERAGITGKKSTARGLRHSMGVMLALDKVPINIIAEILGHKDIKNTLIYLQIMGEDRRKLISNVW